MKVKELRDKLRHYPEEMEVLLLFNDIKEHPTVPRKSFYQDSFTVKKYDHTKKVFIVPATFNEKYLNLYEKYIEMKKLGDSI